MRDTPLIETIQSGAQSMNIELTELALAQLCQYVSLLQKWNKKINLTRLSSTDQIITHHIFDAFSIVNLIQGENICDVGTGAGIPGIILAILFPQKQFTLIDKVQKKVMFLKQVALELKLHNVTATARRVETLKGQAFDTITSRAFSSLPHMLELTQHLGHPETLFLAMKGQYPEHELSKVPDVFRVSKVLKLHVPDLEAERHAVLILFHTQ